MFTGIIEALGKVIRIEKDKDNVHFEMESPFTHELKIDQSVAHNGVCLTVTAVKDQSYSVTAIHETLQKTNLGTWAIGDTVNLERCMQLGGRLDGHIVQGHVDQTGKCLAVLEQKGSWLYTFEYDESKGNVTIEKGSITVNGISLTVVNSKQNQFSVAIIPYTFEHTNLQFIKTGDLVNLEFDIIGKYVSRLMNR
jgi:riboflavin synthase